MSAIYLPYLGESKRKLKKRILEHKGYIRKEWQKGFTSHFATGHGKNPETYLTITAIERVFPNVGSNATAKRLVPERVPVFVELERN